MPGTSLPVLLDDIATIFDDVAAMTEIAARKTAGVLGGDLALNAEQVAGGLGGGERLVSPQADSRSRRSDTHSPISALNFPLYPHANFTAARHFPVE